MSGATCTAQISSGGATLRAPPKTCGTVLRQTRHRSGHDPSRNWNGHADGGTEHGSRVSARSGERLADGAVSTAGRPLAMSTPATS